MIDVIGGCNNDFFMIDPQTASFRLMITGLVGGQGKGLVYKSTLQYLHNLFMVK